MTETSRRTFAHELSIVLSGEAGQGIQTMEQLLTRIAKRSGRYAYAYSEFMSRIRGGNNSSQVRISARRVRASLERIDLFFALDAEAMARHTSRVSAGTVIIADEGLIDGFIADGDITEARIEAGGVVRLPLLPTAKEVGGDIYQGTIILGIICALIGIDRQVADGVIREGLNRLTEEKVEKNIAALAKGYEFGAKMEAEPGIEVDIPADADITGEALLYGSDAIAIGALAGGCDFVSSYPMSPSTGVLTYLAEREVDQNIIVEQAEDEISAMNMAVGAWYAGARAMVTTAGGGFALMIEGVSLAAAVESPVVIHLGQRPAPATGLPTRTEQADLNMALHAGHGEFARVILAPGDHEQSIALTRHAFDLADRYQVPAFVLTDQHLLDSTYPVDESALHEDYPGDLPPVIPTAVPEKHIVRTGPEYLRYRLPAEGASWPGSPGVSPRSIPGYGEGFVCADSDEHDEAGHITEDAAMRMRMVEKRLAKAAGLTEEALPPLRVGRDDARTVVVCWGSTLGAAKEAMESLLASHGPSSASPSPAPSIALLHFSQIYPLHPLTAELLGRAERLILVEGNATGQFGDLLTLNTGHRFDHRILRYDGFPFTVEGLEREFIEQVTARTGVTDG